jgi:hypothetical protein
MGLEPQRAGRNRRVNPYISPPGRLIAVAMNLAVMAATQRDCELIADLSAESGVLCEAQVMGV